MSTRSYIAKQTGDNKYRTIFCHFDGDLEHCGAILLDAYDTAEELDELLSLGDINRLGLQLSPQLGRPHQWRYARENVTVAYARDLGCEKIEARDMTLAQLNDLDSWIKFVYIFDEDGVWRYFEVGQLGDGPRSVKEALDEKYSDSVPNLARGYYRAINSCVNSETLQDQTFPNSFM